MRITLRDLGPGIVIMAKLPGVSNVKTRLGALLNATERSEIAACFLKDSVIKSLTAAKKVFLAFACSPEHEPELAGLELYGTTCFRQSEGDLGRRIADAIAIVAGLGHSPIIVIGTDSPLMDESTLVKAIKAFRDEQIELVIGPSDDGGYNLIGLRAPIPALFENIPWSTGSVYKETISKAKEQGIKQIFELPASYDIDTPDDLFRLFREAERSADLRRNSPETYRWLTANRYVFDRSVD